ncbi:amidohydrolase family, partial [Fusarium albosuccineum]
MEALLLKGGVVLIHDHNDKVAPTRADVLIKGNVIAEIGSSLAAPSGCDVIDCTDSIVSPGFVDTHNHLWQAPLKGLFGDMAFIPYMGV